MTTNQAQPSTQTQTKKQERPRQLWQRQTFIVGSIAAALLLVVTIGVALYAKHQQAKFKAENYVTLSGRIEGAESHLGARLPTQVKAVYVKEGEPVRKGQLLIALDDTDVRAKVNAVDEGLGAAASATHKAIAGSGAVEQEVSEARQQMQPKHHNVISRMFRKVTGAQKKETAFKMQMETQLAAQKQQAQQAVMQAKGEYEKALVARKIISADRSNFRIISPINGIVETRSVEPGDAVTPGQVLLTIVNLHDVYMRGFVAESDVGKLRPGQTAKVYLDSSRQPLSGRISSIDQEASFTPENVYFEKDRASQAFGVKITIDNPDGMAKPGMPADAKINLRHGSQSRLVAGSNSETDSYDSQSQERHQ